MRLWSLHPRYLDSSGLVALWREALLAREVLRGRTRGYTHHPQLERFKGHAAPLSAIGVYLEAVFDEARARGFEFDRRKLGPSRRRVVIPVSRGQLQYEWKHLRGKLRRRSPSVWRKWAHTRMPDAHPLFRIRRGPVEPWERVTKREPRSARSRSRLAALRGIGPQEA